MKTLSNTGANQSKLSRQERRAEERKARKTQKRQGTKFEFVPIKEVLITHSGLAAVGSLINLTAINEKIDLLHIKENPNPDIPHSGVITSYVGLLCQGKSNFDHIEPFREDEGFCYSLGLETVPSSPTLRQRMEQIAATNQWQPIVKTEIAALLKNSRTTITSIVVGEARYIPLDIDVSPFDNSGTKKEGVSYTYKGFDGFSPIFAYLGREGYALNSELREGKDHCQNGTVPFLKETIALAKTATTGQLLARMDSGNDSRDNLEVFLENEVDFIIKRNLRKEKPEEWLAYAKEHDEATKEREGKTVYRGTQTREITIGDKKYEVNLVYVATERTILANGQFLLVPDVEVETYWTTLKTSVEKVEELYHDHGTSEQFHSEIKTDMDLERLPSGKFKANGLVLHLALFAYNILRIMGQFSVNCPETPLRKKAQRRRIRTVIQNMITCAARVIKHSRRVLLGFCTDNKWFPILKSIYDHFSSLDSQPA